MMTAHRVRSYNDWNVASSKEDEKRQKYSTMSSTHSPGMRLHNMCVERLRGWIIKMSVDQWPPTLHQM